MNLRNKAAALLYVVNAVFLIGTGLVFVFSDKFLSFHSDVIQTKWQQVDALFQVLYLGMMRTEGAGFLASGVTITFILLIPFRRKERWSCWAMMCIGVIEYLPTLIANYHVASVSLASPPWPLRLLMITSLLLALMLSLSGIKAKLNCSL